MFAGVLTALITPFTAQSDSNAAGHIDEEGYRQFIEWQIKEGVHGLVPVGTTGESPTLSHEEHNNLVEICVEQTKGRVPVIAGAGSNSTEEAVDFVRHAQKIGADGVLVVTPYYNKPDQKGLYQHFATIAKASSIPIIIYNIPSRSIIDMLPATMAQLRRDFKNIVGVKDATGRMERVSEQREKCGKDFVQLSGDDNSALSFNAQGGVGCISVTSNVAPSLCAKMQEAWQRGDYEEALSIHDRLAFLHRSLFIEPSPAGIKYAVSRVAPIAPATRLPIAPLEEGTKAIIDKALAQAGIVCHNG